MQGQPLQITGLKEKWISLHGRYATYIGDNPEVSGSGEQGTLHCRTFQNFIRTRLSRAGDIANFPNIQKEKRD